MAQPNQQQLQAAFDQGYAKRKEDEDAAKQLLVKDEFMKLRLELRAQPCDHELDHDWPACRRDPPHERLGPRCCLHELLRWVRPVGQLKGQSRATHDESLGHQLVEDAERACGRVPCGS